MKKIKIEDWKVVIDGKDRNENIITVLSALLSMRDPNTLPKGFAKAQMFSRFLTAFKEAETTKELILDDEDYSFFKEMIKTDTPALWGANQNIMKAIENFNN